MMEYTTEHYKRCLNAARDVVTAIEELEEACANIKNGRGWTDFGKTLDDVFDARDKYEKTLSDCCIEVHEKKECK